LDRAKTSPLLLRVISASVLGPIVLAAVWLQGPLLAALVLAGLAGMTWEWGRLAGRGRFGRAGIAAMVTGEAAVGALAFGAGGEAACIVAVFGGAGVYAVTAATRLPEPLWAALGTLWIVLGTVAFLWLAQPPGQGRQTALWLLFVVGANDIAAYFAGRGIGGPKLAPRLSPNKTWAGFVGGVAASGLIGALAIGVGWSSTTSVVAASVLLGVASQLGDLAESLAKRHFGVKDSSGLIPGHGGLLDRVDGLLAASLLAGGISLAAGRSPLLW
jgi:phosphatidate cytidylyltransferase